MTAPLHTSAALDRVRMNHPISVSGEIISTKATDARSAELWRVLRTLEGEHLRDHVRTLTSSNVRLVLFGAAPILADDGVLERVAVVLELRGDCYYRRSPLAWHAYLLSNGDARFAGGARAYLGTRPDIRFWHVLVEEPRPLAALLRDYFASPIPFEEWLASPRVNLGRHAQIERVLLRRLVNEESLAHLIDRESVQAIDRWLAVALSEDERVAWHQRYLTTSDSSRWRPSDPFLDRVLERYRLPTDGHTFWNDVAEVRQSEFIRWIRDRELTSLLGEGERVEFWRRFLGDVERSVESADGAAVFIIFKRWFAVQFKAMGKATYMLSRGHFVIARRLSENNLYRYVLDHESLGRYTHQGDYWQHGAQREVRRVMDAMVRS